MESGRWVWMAMAFFAAGCAGTGEPKPELADPTPLESEAPTPAKAEKPAEINAFTACHTPAKRQEILLDATSRKLLQTVCGATLWFDGLFGERNLDSARRSYGSLALLTEYSEFEGSATRARFYARMRLPALEERLAIFVGLDDEDEFVSDRSEDQVRRSPRPVNDREEFLAGIGFLAVTTERFQSNFRVGVSNPALPKIFAQQRFRYIPYSGARNRLALRLTPYWNNRDLFGVTGHVDFDQAINEALLLRFANVGTFSEISLGLDWRSAIILYQNLRGSSALAYQVFIRGATRAPEPVGEYGVRTAYRWPVLHKSLFLELNVGYGWPREDPTLEREGSASVGFGVEMPFGEAPE